MSDHTPASESFARFDQEYAAAIRDDGSLDSDFSLMYTDESGISQPKPRPHIITPGVVSHARAQGCPAHILVELVDALASSLENFPLTCARLIETETAHLDFSQQATSTPDLMTMMEGLGALMNAALRGTKADDELSAGASHWIGVSDPHAARRDDFLLAIVEGADGGILPDLTGDRIAEVKALLSGRGVPVGAAPRHKATEDEVRSDEAADGEGDDGESDEDYGGGYPKEYALWVCPPTRVDDYYPHYSCPDSAVYPGPGQCSTCGADLEQISASDIDFYLATHELMA